MSLKENLSAIKKGLSTEEQFLEGLIKGERFFRKYKKIFITIIVVVTLSVVGYFSYEKFKEYQITEANIAYRTLLKDPSNVEAKSTLLTNNKSLYDVYTFQMAIKNKDMNVLKELSKHSKNKAIKDLASYYVASLGQNTEDMEAYVRDHTLLKEFGTLQLAFNLLKEGKIDEGKNRLLSFDYDSSLLRLVNNLKNYK